jgi:hypothetical protein
MNRRRFVFWVSFGMFNLSETIGWRALDRLAAAAMRMAEPKSRGDGTGDALKRAVADKSPEHWTQNSNNTWHWFERETFVDGQWKLTGITTPTNIETGEPYTGHAGYLDESQVPVDLLPKYPAPDLAGDARAPIEPAPHTADPSRRARHGRPPSKWLRSLYTEELRIWLKTIDVPEAGVSGMTYWTHLTRDHFFDARHIAGLTIDEEAKLHAAAHYGY